MSIMPGAVTELGDNLVSCPGMQLWRKPSGRGEMGEDYEVTPGLRPGGQAGGEASDTPEESQDIQQGLPRGATI